MIILKLLLAIFQNVRITNFLITIINEQEHFLNVFHIFTLLQNLNELITENYFALLTEFKMYFFIATN